MMEFMPVQKKAQNDSIGSDRIEQSTSPVDFSVPRKYRNRANPELPAETHLKDLLSNSQMFTYDEVEAESPCIRVHQPDHDSTVCSIGNISLVAGKAKSRKTFLVSAIVASALSNSTVLKFSGQLPDDKRMVLYIDTEQSRMDCKKVLVRVSKMLNCAEHEHPENLVFVRLRPYPPKLRLGIIEYAINNIPDVGFVIIDGIKDVVFSINDEAEATDVSSKLMKWSEEKKLHILTVLHKNKTDDNNRGHLGTELENKCETVITVSKDKENKEISVVESQIMRDREFSPFAFSINIDNVPELIDSFSAPVHNKDRQPADYDHQTHRNLLRDIFPANDNCSARTFHDLIKEQLKKYGVLIGSNRCRDFLNFYLEQGLVINKGDSKQHKLVLNENQENTVC
ncbi:MAG: AAA family ATPase [Bacteroidota bacterium]